jgi:predicted metal-dependent enzyme (double-stranded beta helix superfamily)
MSIDSLGSFVGKLCQVIEGHPTEEQILQETKYLMADLVSADDWLPDRYAIANLDYYQQYLLYCDGLKRFSIVSFVWGPGQKTPAHDHTVWGVIGMLRGQEISQQYSFNSNGELVAGKRGVLLPGDVETLSPTIGDIHEVSNGLSDQDSISVHVYGGNIGEVNRHVYAVPTGDRKPFVSGYANSELPNIWQ